MVQKLREASCSERETDTDRIFLDAWEEILGERLPVLISRIGMSGGNTGSAGQRQQQTGPRASRFAEGPFDESEYDNDSGSDDESDSDSSGSTPTPAPETTRAKKQDGENGEPKESQEPLYLFVVLHLLLLLACLIYLVINFGLRLGYNV